MQHSTQHQTIIVFAGGGTGGHLFPALAIARELVKRIPNAEIHFVGTARGLETRLLPQAGFPLHLIAVRGFVRHSLVANIAVAGRLFYSLIQSFRLLRRLKPDLVVGTGGYVSGPVVYMASLLRIPTAIQEQNSYPGVTTRRLADRVDQVHIAFEHARRYFKNPDRLHLSGNPIRPLRTDIAPAVARAYFGLAGDRPTILVFGGSQGARIINQTLLQGLPRLMAESPAQLLWSTGQLNFDQVSSASIGFGDRVVVRPFIDEMDRAYAAADTALCRAGALTCAELAACGVAALLIPFRHAAENHQEYNARALEKQGAARVLTEDQLDADRLVDTLLEILRNPEQREKMSFAARQAALPQATEKIADALLRLIEKSE
ncbi:undecaprenyldiphospho-muramoylpentapeptide beta-N-acetylglucosaminyltransferase [candidate division KSB1 bacterium]|nr:undecaprenyldiphospho-muramoylpentapeptide beta-N-acetylglucosaminyltransferase [candidate division KSB1 bacterium]